MSAAKILMIDDDTDYTSITQIYLQEAADFQVRVVNQGTRGLSEAKLFSPDLILLDISMPDISGLQIADQLAADPALKSVPIIFFTGFYEGHAADPGGKTIKGHTFLTKPTSGEALLQAIQRELKTRPGRRN